MLPLMRGLRLIPQALLGLLLSVTVHPVNAWGITHVLFTVDVESRDDGHPDADIWGRLPDHEGTYGVPLMIDMLAKHEADATFYLNVYEAHKHGHSALREVAERIAERGQDLQLHTHPEPMFGKQGMSSYGQRTQADILRAGQDMIFQWTGARVIAHRAGAYLGNSETLHALSHTGIPVDSSLSPASGSPLYHEGHEENDIAEVEGVLQLPVTYYAQVEVLGWRSVRFLDIESTSLDELKSVLNQMADRSACAANIMMHSFSFTRHGKPDQKVIKKFDLLLKYIQRHPNLKTTSTSDFYRAHQEGKLSCVPQPDFVPHTGIASTYLRAWERFFEGWKNVAVALSVPVIILLVNLWIIATIVRRGWRVPAWAQVGRVYQWSKVILGSVQTHPDQGGYSPLERPENYSSPIPEYPPFPIFP